MSIEFLGTKGTWRDVADSARTTVGMDKGNKEVKENWKKQMLLAEHSLLGHCNINGNGLIYLIGFQFTSLDIGWV